jgi:hypothetical protein
MRYPWKKIAALGFLSFLALWISGIIRGWSLPYPQPVTPRLSLGDEGFYSNSQYANNPNQQLANNLKQIGLSRMSLPLVLEKADVERIRVFEKSAQLAAGTTAFENDEALIRSEIQSHEASILNEKSGGIAPHRQLTVEIGVLPEKFDALVEQLKQIARLESVTAQQHDRTSDFRRLHAQRQSLQQYRDSVVKLRGAKEPSVEDTLKLEQRIQEIEKELQTVSVQLGELLGKESYYTVRATLNEYQPGSRLDRTYTIPQRVFHAFLWALVMWTTGVVGIAVFAGAFVSVRTLWTRTR